MVGYVDTTESTFSFPVPVHLLSGFGSVGFAFLGRLVVMLVVHKTNNRSGSLSRYLSFYLSHSCGAVWPLSSHFFFVYAHQWHK